ncbi:hypothetical protein RFI_01411 [Reticulomyxa filosa]|uniref:Kelch motif family protein n=1 Tax=Reticulomyxa filosa TaxID=46433 RepID=X6PAT1_RETFI|nr:hypothetical protein RFI_01411 [Reticulomyxa filosa]|eukprot:ETO35650.1 hypothetical protein RFI_01411 [Reticulomyxa filosa]
MKNPPSLKKIFSNINNMDNQTTTQDSPERKTEQTKQNQHLVTLFKSLKILPTPLSDSQCVLYKHELIICGGYQQRACYSYHILKNEYKFICEYPSHVILWGHCVVKLVGNSNHNNKDTKQITLLSFGSSWDGENKHTLVMKYVSVWDNISNKANKFNYYNQWVPFTNNHNHPIIIGRYNDDYRGVRAVIDGINNHLLFITYYPKNISVFDLNTFQFIKHDTLPTSNYIQYHCFVSNSENEQGQEMMKTNPKNEQNFQILLFKEKTGLSIEYDENNNIFQFHQLPVCDDIASFYSYAYVHINNVILFFGGWGNTFAEVVVSKLVYKYSIRENKWITFQNALPSRLKYCIAILSEEDNHIHIVGGRNDEEATIVCMGCFTVGNDLFILMKHKLIAFVLIINNEQSKHEIKCINQYWIRTLQIKFGWIDDFDKIIMKYNK